MKGIEVNLTHEHKEAEWKEYGADKSLSQEYGFHEVPDTGLQSLICNIFFGIPIWFGISYI